MYSLNWVYVSERLFEDLASYERIIYLFIYLHFFIADSN